MLKYVSKLMQLSLPKSTAYAQGKQNISRHFYEKSRGMENIHFLKLQREQLKALRKKILRQKNYVTTKMIQMNQEIQSLEKTNPEGRSKF